MNKQHDLEMACKSKKRFSPLVNLAVLLLLFCGSGATCSRPFRNPFAVQLGPPAPEILQPGSTLQQVIAAVNQNSARIVSYQSNDASITVPGMPGIPLLRGNLAAQRPGRVRLQASTTLTGPEVDLGSNDELFWFWVKRNEPPALYFSRHDQFVGSAAQQLMPVEPQWLLDALGMMQFAPTDQHEGPIPHGNGTVEVRSVMQTRGGTMTKTTVIDARRAWVMEQHIYDPTGTLLASAVARSHRYYPEIGASLPQKVELRLPAMQMSLSINVGTVVLNQIVDNPQLWALPVMSGYSQVDLGSAPPGGVPPISSAASRDWSTGASPAILGLTPETLNRTSEQLTSVPQFETSGSIPPQLSATTQYQATLPAPLTAQATQPIQVPPVARTLPPGGVPASTYAR